MAGMTASGDFDPDEDFYEDDEPLEDVLAAYERGIKGVTARPSRIELSAPDVMLPELSSTAVLARIYIEPAAPVRVRATQVQAPAQVR